MQINSINLYRPYSLTNLNSVKPVTMPTELVSNEKRKSLPKEIFESFRAQAIYSPSFLSKRSILEHPLYNIENSISKPIADNKIVNILKKLTKPNGIRPVRKDKDIYSLIDG